MSSTNLNYDKILRISIFGSVSVGKSNIINRFINDKFENNSDPTIGSDFYDKEIKKNNKIYQLQILDTAGEEKIGMNPKLNIKGANGVIICYDITSRESYEKIFEENGWLNFILDNGNKINTIFLVGNKIDLENEREILKDEAMEKAKEHEIFFIETSAKINSNKNIEIMFDLILEDIIKNDKDEDTGFFTITNKKQTLISNKIKIESNKCCN